MTTEAQKYEGFGWIKVKRAKAVEISDKKYVPEEHHVEETSFLIKEIKKLAAIIDKKNAAIRKLRSQQYNQSMRDYQSQFDYLPYEEDDRA